MCVMFVICVMLCNVMGPERNLQQIYIICLRATRRASYHLTLHPRVSVYANCPTDRTELFLKRKNYG